MCKYLIRQGLSLAESGYTYRQIQPVTPPTNAVRCYTAVCTTSERTLRVFGNVLFTRVPPGRIRFSVYTQDGEIKKETSIAENEQSIEPSI